MKLTASAIRTYLDCPRKFEWSYVHQIRPAKQADALRFGSLYHGVLERLDIGIDWNNISRWVVNAAATEVEAHQVLRLASAHATRWKDDGYEVLETEGVWSASIGGVACAGKRDRIVRLPDRRRALQEYKTSSEDVSPGGLYHRRLRMDIQVGLYRLSSDVDTVIYDITRKPTIRQKQTETADEYGERLSADIASRPEYYFARYEVPRTEHDDLAVIEDVRAVDRMISLNVYPRNTASCTRFGQCPYFAACSANMKPGDGVPAGFVQLKTAHPELEGDEEDPQDR